jgi:hypothetical protein
MSNYRINVISSFIHRSNSRAQKLSNLCGFRNELLQYGLDHLHTHHLDTACVAYEGSFLSRASRVPGYIDKANH